MWNLSCDVSRESSCWNVRALSAALLDGMELLPALADYSLCRSSYPINCVASLWYKLVLKENKSWIDSSAQWQA